jgi:hypothetical protein
LDNDSQFTLASLTPFLPSLGVFCIVLLLTRLRAVATWNSPLGKRLFVFLVPCAAFYLPLLVVQQDLSYFRFERVLTSGLEWLILFEIAAWLNRRLANRPVARIPILFVTIWFLEGPVFLLLSLLTTGGDFSADSFTQRLTPNKSLYAVYGILTSATLVILAITFQRAPSSTPPARRYRFWRSAHAFETGGFHDMEMSPACSHTTRLLCASAVLNGASFRRMVLQYLEDPSRAVAPEIGLDLRLVAQVCKFLQDRDRRFDWWFSACILVGIVGAVIDSTLGLIAFIISAGGVWITKVWPQHFTFPLAFGKPIFDPDRVAKQFNAQLESEHLASIPPADQNLIVYSGFSPFVGAGSNLGGWSFVVNVTKGKEDTGSELGAIPFATSALYERIEQSLDSLGLNGLTHQTMFYAHGSDIRNDRQLLPNAYGRPVSSLDPNQVQKYSLENDRHVRQYKWIRVTDWGNELTTSYFLRCTQRGNSLFVEINRCLLTPLAQAYRGVDAKAEEDWKVGVSICTGSVIVGPLRALVAPLMLLGHLRDWWNDLLDRKNKEHQELIDDHPLYNYGVAQSFRESMRSDLFLHYFQKLDGDFYSKVLEREILAAILAFLDEHNIDTSELKERQSTILNSGIIVHGGDVKAESLAVGAGAQAVQVSKPQPVSKPRFRRAAVGGES